MNVHQPMLAPVATPLTRTLPLTAPGELAFHAFPSPVRDRSMPRLAKRVSSVRRRRMVGGRGMVGVGAVEVGEDVDRASSSNLKARAALLSTAMLVRLVSFTLDFYLCRLALRGSLRPVDADVNVCVCVWHVCSHVCCYCAPMFTVGDISDHYQAAFGTRWSSDRSSADLRLEICYDDVCVSGSRRARPVLLEGRV